MKVECPKCGYIDIIETDDLTRHDYTVDTPTLRGTKKDHEVAWTYTCPDCGKMFEV